MVNVNRVKWVILDSPYMYFILFLFCLEEALLKLQLLKTKVTVLIFG